MSAATTRLSSRGTGNPQPQSRTPSTKLFPARTAPNEEASARAAVWPTDSEKHVSGRCASVRESTGRPVVMSPVSWWRERARCACAAAIILMQVMRSDSSFQDRPRGTANMSACLRGQTFLLPSEYALATDSGERERRNM